MNQVEKDAKRIIELKPCPFCGGTAALFSDCNGREAYAMCIECLARSATFTAIALESNTDSLLKYHYRRASEAWNRRV